MNTLKKFGLIAVTLSSVAFLQSCEDGTFEEAGEEVDRLASDVADETEDAARDAGNAVEDACENVTDSNC